MSSSAEQNRRKFAASPFTWRSQSAPNRDKWYRRGPLSRQRSRQESSVGESTQILDHMVSRRLVSAIAAWHDLHVSLLQLSMSKAELNNIERKEINRKLTLRRRNESDENSSPSLVDSKRHSKRGRIEQRRISTKIHKIPPLIRQSTFTKNEQDSHQTISSQSSSSTSLSFLCSSTTNDDNQNKKLEKEIIIEKENKIKNLKFQNNFIGQHKEHSLIHQNTAENNEKTNSPPTWTATFAQSLQIRSSSTRRRIRSPRPSSKHVLILKHSVQLLEPKIQGIEYIQPINNKIVEKTIQSPDSPILTIKGKRRCFSVAKLDENRRKQLLVNYNRRRQCSYQSEDTDNEAIISDSNNITITSCSSQELLSETELDLIYNEERIHSRSCLSSPELSPDELKQLFPELSDHWRKALAKSPVVKRAAALQEQEQKRATKHRTSRYWLEEQINPSEHIWLPSCSISSSTTVDTECYLGETDCGRIGEKRRCAACHIVAHTECFPLLAKMNLNCKSTYRDCINNRRQNCRKSQDVIYKHHWVHRWKLEGRCFHCGKSFQQKMFREKEVIAINCSWCKRSYHNKRSCFSLARFDDRCDRGILRELILPPNWLLRLSNQRNKHKLTTQQQQTLTTTTINNSLKRNRKKYRPFIVKFNEQTQNNVVVSSLINSKELNKNVCQQPPIQPLLAFVNPKSGGNKGSKALNSLCWLLNPRQVFDINTMHGPKYGLEIFRKMTNQMRILVCGGDGTVGWLLSTLDQLNWNNYPPIAILPLGTGNDLSRSMGWGGTFSDEPLTEILQAIQTETSITFLDRWRLDVFPLFSINNQEQQQQQLNNNNNNLFCSSEQQFNNNNNENKEYNNTINNECQNNLPLSVMNNYFSIGADAHVALQFHHSRSANPQMLNSRLKNRLAYGGLGTIDLFKRAWKDLSEYITVECDGVDISPKIKEFKFHCVLFHNISFYAGGTIPWGQGGDGVQESCGEVFSRPSPCDGKIEVLGFTTATLATLQMGGRGERIAQCSNVRIETSKPIPMQVDGEPCLLGPSLIHLSFHNKVPMLKREKFARLSGSAPTNNIISMNANRRRKNSNQNNNNSNIINIQNNNQINEQNNGLKTTTISSPINQQQHKISKASLSSYQFPPPSSPPNNINNISVCIPIVVVGRHDYDTFRDSVDRLKDTGFELGTLILEAELELNQVRERIQKMLSEHQILPYEPGNDWRFLDYVSSPEEGTFRISQQQEYCKTVADVSSLDETNSAIIILDDAFPSMTVRSAAIGHDLVFNPAGVKQIKTLNEKNNLMRRRIGETLRIVLSTDSQETHL